MNRFQDLKKAAEEEEARELKSQVAEVRTMATPGEQEYAAEFWGAIQELFGMFLYKSGPKQYGTAFTQTGVLGAVVALTGDVARLRQMVLKNSDHGRRNSKAVEDKLRDVAVQSIIGLLMLQESNWEGLPGKVKVTHDHQD